VTEDDLAEFLQLAGLVQPGEDALEALESHVTTA
jgi:hypothetical protein